MKNKMNSPVRIIVTSSAGELEKTVSRLKRRGMKVDSILEAVGVVTGEIPESKLAALQKTAGITVERDEFVQLPPPDAPVQ